MKKRFTEEQIIKIIARNRNGETAKKLGREFGVSEQSIYAWKKKYHNMTVSDAKKLRELEAENSQLKKIVANQALDIVMLKDVNSKKW
jgi:putative transposase